MSGGTLALPTTGTFSGLTAAQDINAALASLATLNQSASAPTAAGLGLASLAGVVWHDTTGNLLKVRDQADSAWITVGAFNETTKLWTPYLNGSALAIPSADGFVNALRNNSLTSWFHGTSGTITTAGGWTAEGVYALPTGASITWAQATSGLPSGCPTVDGLTLTGATSVTDLKIRFVIESYTAAKLAGQTCTFQLPIVNNTGGSITPTIATKYPTAQDNWTGSTTDLATTNLQAVANSASGTLCYTFNVNAGAANGYEIIIDFGNNFSSNAKSVTLGGGFDFRATPGTSTGLNSSPPTPEVRGASSDMVWNERFYQTTYANGTAPGTVGVQQGMTGGNAGSTNGNGIAANFRSRMRASPSVTIWDEGGNSGFYTLYTSGGFTNSGGPPQSGVELIGHTSFVIRAMNSGSQGVLFHYAADATLTGA